MTPQNVGVTSVVLNRRGRGNLQLEGSGFNGVAPRQQSQYSAGLCMRRAEARSIGEAREAFGVRTGDEVFVSQSTESAAQFFSDPIHTAALQLQPGRDLTGGAAACQQTQNGTRFGVKLPITVAALHRDQIFCVRGWREVRAIPQHHLDGCPQALGQIVGGCQVSAHAHGEQIADDQSIGGHAHDDEARRRMGCQEALNQDQCIEQGIEAVAQEDQTGFEFAHQRQQAIAIFDFGDHCISALTEKRLCPDHRETAAVCDQDVGVRHKKLPSFPSHLCSLSEPDLRGLRGWDILRAVVGRGMRIFLMARDFHSWSLGSLLGSSFAW